MRITGFRFHRPRLVLASLVCVFVGAVVPVGYSAPVRATKDADDRRNFLTALALAEKTHDYNAVLALCDRQVAAHPSDIEGHRRRALARWGARQYDGALAEFDRAATLARRQKSPARLLAILAYGRALIRREQHDTAAEAAELERAARADRSFTDALNDLAWIRATNPDASLRNGAEAVELARHACEVMPGSVKYLDTLAAAYAESGDPKRAADTEKEAIKAARTDARTAGEHKDFLADAPERAELYAKGERHRETPRPAANPRG